jgi:hypothetical protein
MIIDKHTDEYKYLEVKGTLQLLIRELRFMYNQGSFQPALKRYIHNLLKEGELTLKRVSE